MNGIDSVLYSYGYWIRKDTLKVAVLLKFLGYRFQRKGRELESHKIGYPENLVIVHLVSVLWIRSIFDGNRKADKVMNLIIN